MGLHINGRNIAAMRFGGADAVEARLNGAVVWPDTPPPPVDPWPTKPYLYLANGERFQCLKADYDPKGPSYDPGGMLKIGVGENCSLLYPDSGSPGANLRYDFQSGAYITYTSGDAFRIYDRNGVFLDPKQSLPEMPTTYNVELFYAYVEDTLIMGLFYSTVARITVSRRASSGVPGSGYTRAKDTWYGFTEEYIQKYHAIAMALTGGSL